MMNINNIAFTGKVGRKGVDQMGAFNALLKGRVRGKTGPRYESIDTTILVNRVVEVAQRSGYTVDSINASATGRKSTKHVVRIRFAGLKGDGQNTYFPELVLFNSYDGEQSLRFSTGLFRLVCSNGLTIGEGITEQVRHRHIAGPKTEQFVRTLDTQIAACLKDLSGLGAVIERLQSVKLPATTELRITESLKLSKRMSENLRLIRDGYAGRDHEQNLWAYYNAVNEVLRKGSRSTASNEFRNMNLLSTIEEAYEKSVA